MSTENFGQFEFKKVKEAIEVHPSFWTPENLNLFFQIIGFSSLMGILDEKLSCSDFTLFTEDDFKKVGITNIIELSQLTAAQTILRSYLEYIASPSENKSVHQDEMFFSGFSSKLNDQPKKKDNFGEVDFFPSNNFSSTNEFQKNHHELSAESIHMTAESELISRYLINNANKDRGIKKKIIDNDTETSKIELVNSQYITKESPQLLSKPFSYLNINPQHPPSSPQLTFFNMDEPSRLIRVLPPDFKFGRSDGINNYKIAGNGVSREHAQIIFNGNFYLENLSKSSATFIKLQEKIQIKKGLIVEIGDKILEFREEMRVLVNGKERRIELDEGVAFIGRGPECQIRLEDGLVSGKHGFVKKTDEEYFLHDNKSANGIWIKLEPNQKYELKIRTEFKIAQYVFCITSVQTGEVFAQGKDLQCKQCGNPCSTALEPCGEILCVLCLGDNKSCPICGQAIEKIFSNPSNISFKDFNDYASDILLHLINKEKSLTLFPKFLSSGFSFPIRERLIVWIIEICEELHFRSKIKYDAALYVDIYLSKTSNFPYEKLQLLGIVAIMVAIKLEENIMFHISDVKYLCGDQYSEEEILAQEISLLKALEWKLVQPNLAEIIRLLFGCFVEEPQEEVYQRVEGSLDYCISSEEFWTFDQISLACACIGVYLEELESEEGKMAFQNLIHSIAGFNMEHFEKAYVLLINTTQNNTGMMTPKAIGTMEDEKSTAGHSMDEEENEEERLGESKISHFMIDFEM